MRFGVRFQGRVPGYEVEYLFGGIKLDELGKFCPVCKNKNVRTALVCSYCGASLDEIPTNAVATTQKTGEQAKAPGESVVPFVDVALIPEGGVGMYIAGTFLPQYYSMDNDLIIGRKPEVTTETFLELPEADAFNLGLSRRHAMLRRAKPGFEVIDLSSTNGTWLNSERLVPNKPYSFASGAQLRFGHMRLFVIFHTDLKGLHK
ncbi:MAG: FHA domain-containing protein [Chloroflexota bacterium]